MQGFLRRIFLHLSEPHGEDKRKTFDFEMTVFHATDHFQAAPIDSVLALVANSTRTSKNSTIYNII